jgi:sugar phosphate isomerase/epimerase
MKRRQFLARVVQTAAAVSTTALVSGAGASPVPAERTAKTPAARERLGVCSDSYALARAPAAKQANAPVRDARRFLEYCHLLGAGGIQINVSPKVSGGLAGLRSQAEVYGMYVEGQVSRPVREADLPRFESDVRAAKEAGAEVLRTTLIGSRRYEAFGSAADFERALRQAWQSLTLAEPVVKKHRMRLAIENHKDFRVPELLDLVKRISSEHVGICVDLHNSIALLEEPMAVVAAYAPWAASVHLKDAALKEYEEGFLLADVPLGDGLLDLPAMVATLRKAAPKVHFSLEMMTRDPLKVPCLTPKYWATMATVPGSDLARTLTLVRSRTGVSPVASRTGVSPVAKTPTTPLPSMAGLSPEQRLKLEDDNVRKCLAYAQSRLGL